MPTKAELEFKVQATLDTTAPSKEDPYVYRIGTGASMLTLLRRVFYRGKKARSATKKLIEGVPCLLLYEDGTIVNSLVRFKRLSREVRSL